MRLLDGGFEAWKAKEFPTQLTSPQFKPVSFRFPPKSGVSTLLATLQQVKGARGAPQRSHPGRAAPVLLLGRGDQRRRGPARTYPRRGVGLLGGESGGRRGLLKGCWKSPEELRELYASRGVTPDKDIYIYTHRDRCATFSLVSLYLAGYPLEKLHLYAGSWIEWSRSREPAETGPAR